MPGRCASWHAGMVCETSGGQWLTFCTALSSLFVQAARSMPCRHKAPSQKWKLYVVSSCTMTCQLCSQSSACQHGKPELTSSLTPQPWLSASRRVLRSEEPCHRTLEPCVFLRKATRVCSVALTTSLSEAASRLERCCNSSAIHKCTGRRRGQRRLQADLSFSAT